MRFFEFHPTFAQARAYNDYQRQWFDEKVQTARHLDEFKRFGDRLRAKNYPVKIKLGLEICYFPQHADVIEQVTRDGYFDLLLGSVHIGEVQASVWDKATREACAKAGIPLL